MSKLTDKLDSRAQVQLAVSELPEDLDLLLRLDAELSDEHKAMLETAGCLVTSAVGNVVVGRSKKFALEDIAEQSFVRRIELSREIYSEKPSEE